jgi:hypothetical protein
MGAFWKVAKQIAAAVVLWALSAGYAASEDEAIAPAPPITAPMAQPADAGGANPVPRQVPCRETGNSCPPNLSLDPSHWPPPCWSVPYDQFDPLLSQCPSKDDYYILPPRNCWYFMAEGGAMHRMPTHGVDFAMTQPPPGSANPQLILSTSNFNYDFAAAGNFLIGHTLNQCLQVEAAWTGVEAAENTDSIRDSSLNMFGANGAIFSPFNNFGGLSAVGIPGLDFNKYATITYRSSLQSAEVNIRRQMPMPPEQLTVSILFGVRYIGLPEDFKYYTQSDVTSAGTVVTNGSINNIHVATNNSMVGPQIGARFDFYVENRWWVNFEMKAAILNNHAAETSTYTNVNDGVTTVYTSADSGNHTAFAGDLNLTCAYRWSPHFMTRLGYHALFLTGQALGQNNFSNNIDNYTNLSTQLNHGSNIAYHGPFAGVEFGW